MKPLAQNLVSPFYRVATRAIVLNDQQCILVMQNHDDEYELPGGGWEYNEMFEDCLAREIKEELGVELTGCGPLFCTYRGLGSRGSMYLRIAVRATLRSFDFLPVDMASAKFVTQDQFMALDLKPAGEEGLKAYADQIWQGSIKKAQASSD